jgi:integrase
MTPGASFDRLESGPVFRSVDRHGNVGAMLSRSAVGSVVKQYAARAGMDPRDFGGHSLRAGFVTSAAERGAKTERIMDHTGHKSVAMVRVYARRVDSFTEHAGDGLL